MPKNDFKDYVCRPYCIFFKEGQKEEMACRGAEVIEEMTLQRHLDPDALPRFEKDGRLWKNYKKIFAKYLCASCAFKDNDCDFVTETPGPSADGPSADERIEPCGGFILLALMIENDFIDMAVLEDAL